MKQIIAVPAILILATISNAQGLNAEFIDRQIRPEKTFKATEAHQGVAVDDHHVYAINNRAIGKHDKQSGKRLAIWKAAEDSPLKHMNSGVVINGKLYCAHSTWPNSPRENSVEIWDTKTLKHIGRQTFPASDGALTWVDFHQGSWWGCFAHYGEAEQVQRTEMVRFNKQWIIEKSWKFPTKILKSFLPYSCSGGSWGPDGYLYTTGHDRKAAYVLNVTEDNEEMGLVGTMSIPTAGQGIAWDRGDISMLYGNNRSAKEIHASRVFFHELPPKLLRWLGPQEWQRDTDGPIVSLGKSNAFDDTHIFAPCVAQENDCFRLWYCGSTGTVAERVFQLGLAKSDDGREFHRVSTDPAYSFGDGKHSVLTPTLLHGVNGAVVRDHEKLRMWFSATHFSGPTGLHTLHETTSSDGNYWSKPTPPQLKNVYAPTIIKTDEKYLMWYTDVAADPWVIRHAKSDDGQQWKVHEQPVLTIDQPWERTRLFYPTVVKTDGIYLMWYGSYWNGQSQKTAIGFAVSIDGIRWHKHPQNPVLRPDKSRPWESHYTTSQSVMRLPNGTWRIWYASRKSPPFVNKYFAINTAHWMGPKNKLDIE